MGQPVVHFEINTASGPELTRFYAGAFGWAMHPDGDDYTRITTGGVCAGTGAPGIDGGIGSSHPGDDFVTFYVQVQPTSWTRSSRSSSSEETSTCPRPRPGASSSRRSATRPATA